MPNKYHVYEHFYGKKDMVKVDKDFLVQETEKIDFLLDRTNFSSVEEFLLEVVALTIKRDRERAYKLATRLAAADRAERIPHQLKEGLHEKEELYD